MTAPTTVTVTRTSTITYYKSEPLLALLPGRTKAQIAETLGVSEGAIDNWRAGRPLHRHTADRCAIALGLHMGNIW